MLHFEKHNAFTLPFEKMQSVHIARFSKCIVNTLCLKKYNGNTLCFKKCNENTLLFFKIQHECFAFFKTQLECFKLSKAQHELQCCRCMLISCCTGTMHVGHVMMSCSPFGSRLSVWVQSGDHRHGNMDRPWCHGPKVIGLYSRKLWQCEPKIMKGR